MNNLNEIFESQKNKLRDKSLFWHKENGNWVSISWNEAGRQINILSEFLKKIEINKGDRVSLISKNSPIWCISDLAIMKIGAITVPAYTTSNENELLYLLNHSESKLALLDEEAYLKIKKIKKKLIFTKKFILLENCKLKKNLQYQDKKLLEEFGIVIISANKEINLWLKTINGCVALIRPDRYLYGIANDYSSTKKLLHSLRS